MFHGRFFTRREASNHSVPRPSARRANRHPPGRLLRLEPLEDRRMLNVGDLLPGLSDPGIAQPAAQQAACMAAADTATLPANVEGNLAAILALRRVGVNDRLGGRGSERSRGTGGCL